MQIDLATTNLSGSTALDSHVRRRLAFALGQLSHRIRSAAVTLSDVNGPRGGRDKRCHVRVELHPRGTVVLTDVAPDVYKAVDRAASRLKRAAARAIERRCPRRGRKGG